MRLSLVHLLLRYERPDDARAELDATTELLRARHADLALIAETIDVNAPSAIGAVIQLRNAWDLRENADQLLRSVDFSQPN